MNRPVIPALLLVAGSALAQSSAPAPQRPPALGPIEWVEAAPEKGFHHPYLLRRPTDASRPRAGYLLVEPNNTGEISDDPAFHRAAAEKLAKNALGQQLARTLNAPLLVPCFPRPKTEWMLYTHLLDRDTLLLPAGPLRRLDLQLIAMADDARERLRAQGFELDEKLLLTGFSASGSFVQRFTMLHPARVKAVAAGGLNGMLMLPLAKLGGKPLSYPIGLADFRRITGREFDRAEWLQVPQFLYMGERDDNDAVQFDDGYSKAERRAIYRLLGERSNPDRWARVQAIHRESGAAITFRTFPGIGHGTDGRIDRELTEFFTAAIATRPIRPGDFYRVAGALPEQVAKAADVASWLAERSVVLIDVRSKESYARGHLRGAVNLPATELTDEALKRVVPSPESRIVIYCDDNLAPTRRIALTTLGYPAIWQLGYRNLFSLEEVWNNADCRGAGERLDFEEPCPRWLPMERPAPAAP